MVQTKMRRFMRERKEMGRKVKLKIRNSKLKKYEKEEEEIETKMRKNKMQN